MYKVGDITGEYKWTNSKRLGWFKKAEHLNDIVGYTGINSTDSGYFYCPYVPYKKVMDKKL